MADSKISALPASTTPLAGTEVLPIVQSSTTRQVSVANLTAGRAISATQLTLTTGSVIVASGQGIDFSATTSSSGTMTSELLADYEEGTFTPNLLFGGGNTGMTYSNQLGRYTKIGRVVYYTVVIYLTAKGSSTGNTTISGFPYTSSASSTFYEGKIDTDNVIGLVYEPIAQMGANTTILSVYINVTGQQQNVSDSSFANNSRFFVTGFYEA